MLKQIPARFQSGEGTLIYSPRAVFSGDWVWLQKDVSRSNRAVLFPMPGAPFKELVAVQLVIEGKPITAFYAPK